MVCLSKIKISRRMHVHNVALTCQLNNFKLQFSLKRREKGFVCLEGKQEVNVRKNCATVGSIEGGTWLQHVTTEGVRI